MKSGIKDTIPKILVQLARTLGTEITNSRLKIPVEFGKGYCAGYIFNEHIRMIVSNYELNEEIAIENPEVNFSNRIIFFKFQNIFPRKELFQQDKPIGSTPSVLIATSRINIDEIISIHSNTATVTIYMDADYLNGLFNLPKQSPVLKSLLQNTQPLLFEQILYPPLHNIVDEIVAVPIDETFELFFLRVKAEELICRLLMELEKRDEKRLYALNNKDVHAVYKVKERMLADVQNPPVIKELAADAGMSPTKLHRLFKQVFAESLFSYYQQFRMKESARLLKESKMSVSEVGYQMGFTNLSHFSRVFKKHMGMNPKQFSRS